MGSRIFWRWEPNQVKFLIFDNNNGLYFMGDHTPVPATYKINNFGYLQIEPHFHKVPPIQYKKLSSYKI